MMVRFSLRQIVVAVGAALLVALLSAGAASAHAELVSSSPTPESVLATSPNQIVLTFDEAVDPVNDSIRLVAGDGRQVSVGAARQDSGQLTLAVDVPDLSNGSYVVAWRAISADGHPVNGAFTFSVGAASPTGSGLIPSLLAGDRPSNSVQGWLAVGRVASYLGVALLVGGLLVLAVCAPAMLGTRRAGRLLLVGVAIGVVGTAVMIAAQATLSVDDMWSWSAVYRSQAGRWWFIRLALLVVAIVPVAGRRRYRPAGAWPAVLAFSGVGLLAVVAAGGHGVAGRLVVIGMTITVVHLAAMSLWVGGLAVMIVGLRRDVWVIASRFSPLALGAVATLAATGTINAWRQAGSWSALTASHYGTWLFVKVVVVVGVLAMASAARRLVRVPDAAPVEMAMAGSVGAMANEPAPADAGRAVRRVVIAEACGIVLVLAVTAGLVSSAPPRVATAAKLASATAVHGDRLVQVTVDPAVIGGTVMHVYLSSTSGSLDQPSQISVAASLAARQIGPLAIPTIRSGPGHVTTNDANLPTAGTWTFAVTARYGEFDQVVFTVQLQVR